MKNLAAKFQEFLFTPWVLVGALVAGFGVIILIQNKPGDEQPFDLAESFPQTFMTQVETREFDAQGRLQHVINTPRITQYQINPDAPSDQDYTLIDQPKIDLYQDNRTTPWHISARLGQTQANSKELRLTGDVLIHQDSSDQGPIDINTTELWVYPSKQFAQTDKAVTMRGTAIQVDAVGMEAHLLDDNIQLKSHVRATYEPKR